MQRLSNHGFKFVVSNNIILNMFEQQLNLKGILGQHRNLNWNNQGLLSILKGVECYPNVNFV